MKTKVGHFYIFFNEHDFHSKVIEYSMKGHEWVYGGTTLPNLDKSDYPIALNCDSSSMLFSIIENYKKEYFNDPIFVKLYNTELQKIRKKKLLKLIENHDNNTFSK